MQIQVVPLLRKLGHPTPRRLGLGFSVMYGNKALPVSTSIRAAIEFTKKFESICLC